MVSSSSYDPPSGISSKMPRYHSSLGSSSGRRPQYWWLEGSSGSSGRAAETGGREGRGGVRGGRRSSGRAAGTGGRGGRG